jgi:hypothetical protein
MARRISSPRDCPICGASVPTGAKSCPECGADERTGWNEEATRYDGLDLPDSAFDHDEMLRDEGLKPRRLPVGIPIYWWLVGLALLLVIIKLSLGF